MYEVVNGITVGDNYFAEGELIDNKKVPQKSIKWLLEQNLIIKVDKAYKEKN